MTHEEILSDPNYNKALAIVMELDKYAVMRDRHELGLPISSLGEGYDGLAEMLEIVLNILNQK